MIKFLVLVQVIADRTHKTIEITARDCFHVDEICAKRGLLALSIEIA